jgi:hypothetical protein
VDLMTTQVLVAVLFAIGVAVTVSLKNKNK